jgi:cobaltochelatase CobS
MAPPMEDYGKKAIKSVARVISDDFAIGTRSLTIKDLFTGSGLNRPLVLYILHATGSGSLKELLSAEGIQYKISKDEKEITMKAGSGKRRPVKASTLFDKQEDDANLFLINPRVKLKILASLLNGIPLWLVGPTGCGKSQSIAQLCESLVREYVRFPMNNESSADNMLGYYRVDAENGASKFVWVDGVLPQAMKLGKVLICEEIDAAAPGVNLVLQKVLERRPGQPASFYNTANNEEVIAAPGFCIVGTANTAGSGDEDGSYRGTLTQNAAFLDRFMFQKMDYMDKDHEIALLIRRGGMDKKTAKGLREFAETVRSKVASRSLTTTVSTRSLLSMCELFHSFKEISEKHGPHLSDDECFGEAFRASISDRCSTDGDSATMKQAFQRIFGDAKTDSAFG